jgi:hypothetical protein
MFGLAWNWSVNVLVWPAFVYLWFAGERAFVRSTIHEDIEPVQKWLFGNR